MASRISGVGFVTVSLRRSIIGVSLMVQMRRKLHRPVQRGKTPTVVAYNTTELDETVTRPQMKEAQIALGVTQCPVSQKTVHAEDGLSVYLQ